MTQRIKELDKDNHPGFLGIQENVRMAGESTYGSMEDADVDAEIARDGDVFAEWSFPHPGAFFKRGAFLRRIAKELHVAIYEIGSDNVLYHDVNGERGEEAGVFTVSKSAIGYHR